MAAVEQNGGDAPPNPLEPAAELVDSSSTSVLDSTVHPQQDVMETDSAVTKAEKHERHGGVEGLEESPTKRRKVDASAENGDQVLTKSERQKGVVPIKAESASSRALREHVAYSE